MTKINKLGKSTFVIAILSFLLVAVLAFGGTYAYFSASAGTVSGAITTGHLRVGEITGNAVTDAGSELQNTTLKLDGTLAQPNQTIVNDDFKALVTYNIAYYTRVKFTVTVDATGHNHEKETGCEDEFDTALKALTINVAQEGWDEGKPITADEGTAGKAKETTSKYYYKLAPQLTTITTAAAEKATTTETFHVSVKVNPMVGVSTIGDAVGCEYWMNAKITISVTFEVLQADYLNASEDDKVDEASKFADGDAAEAAWIQALKGEEATA